MEVFARVNWVDIIAVILILRISYVGSFLGIGKQILPLLSLLLTLTCSLYYYDNIALFITKRLTLSTSVTEFFVFLLLLIIFLFISRRINRYISFKRPEVIIPIEHIGGTILAFLRSVVVAGLVFATFLLMPIGGVEESVRSSMTGNFITKINLDFYSNIVNTFMSKRSKDKNKLYEKTTTLDMFEQLTKKKDYKLNLFGSDLKEKSRFFKEKELK